MAGLILVAGCGRPVPTDGLDPSPSPTAPTAPAICGGQPRVGFEPELPSGSVWLAVDAGRLTVVQIHLSGEGKREQAHAKGQPASCTVAWNLGLVLHPPAASAPLLTAVTVDFSRGWMLSRGWMTDTMTCDGSGTSNGDGWFRTCAPETRIEGSLTIDGDQGSLCLTIDDLTINVPDVTVDPVGGASAARCP